MSFSNVRPISKEGGAGKHHVHLSEGVFSCEIATAAELTSVYIPERDVCVSHAYRFDGRRLIMGVIAPLLAMAIGLPIMFGVDALTGDEANDWALGVVTATFFVGLGLSFMFTAVQVVRFSLRQRTTILCAEADEGVYEFEFWHPAGKNGELDDIVEILAANLPRESPAPNILFTHDWSYTRPIRTVLTVMLAVFFIDWTVLLVSERVFSFLGLDEIQVPFGIGLLCLIPILGLASYSLSSYRLAHAEPGHSTALKHVINRHYNRARKDTDIILDAQPEDLDALTLAIHIRLRQGKLEEIAPFCRKIDELSQEDGAEMFLRIMQVWDVDPNATVDGA